jgi:hypothetical protein
VGAHGLDAGTGDEQVDDVVIGPEGHGDPAVTPARAGPSQNCLPRIARLPLAGTTQSNSTGPLW